MSKADDATDLGVRLMTPGRTYLAVNGGVFLCAWLSHQSSTFARSLSQSHGDAVGAAVGTVVLYLIVFLAAEANLQGRRRSMRSAASAAPIAILSIVSHPIGSAVERLYHERYLAAPAAAAVASISDGSSLSTWLLGAGAWWLWLAVRLLAFELVFDFFFYLAHRAVHAHPTLYKAVHKLHHRHTHELWLLSSLQMSSADVVLTHTLPVLGALAVVPLAAGLEISVAKTYLLFQVRTTCRSHPTWASLHLASLHLASHPGYLSPLTGHARTPAGALRPRGRRAQGAQLWAGAVARADAAD